MASESMSQLRDRAESAERQLREHEVQAAVARSARIASEQAVAEKRIADEHSAARAVEIEAARRGCWVTFNLKSACAEQAVTGPRPLGDAGYDALLKVPETGWAPGSSADDFTGIPAGYVATASTEAAQTPMGKRLAEMMENAERLRNARETD